MPKFTADTKFLGSQDIPGGTEQSLTIKTFGRENVGFGANAQEKWIIYFREIRKGLALNTTNGKRIAESLGTDEMDEWIGRKITIFVDENVEYAGKNVPAIRVKVKKAEYPVQEQHSAEEIADFTPDQAIAKLQAARSVVEVFSIKKLIAKMAWSNEEKAELNDLSDYRMTELKGK